MIPFANIKPTQTEPIPWGWTNETTADGLVFVKEHPGRIEMPRLKNYFDWNRYEVVCPPERGTFDLGTTNMKSTFTTAARFLGYETLLTEQPDLGPIAYQFYDWNQRLLERIQGIKYFIIGDDIAHKGGLMMSPDLWRRWIRPYLKMLIELAKGYGCQVVYHSDGDIAEIINDLADLGVFAIDGERVGRMVDADLPVQFYENTDPFREGERSHWG